MDREIVIIEDEERIASLLKDYLEASGYVCRIFLDGISGLTYVTNNSPLLILLDLMLPGMDGREICTKVRKISNVPIIMLTAQVQEDERLQGLNLGADDYICKPFSPREVVARVQAVLRRSGDIGVASSQSTENDKNIQVTDGCNLTYNGMQVQLTAIEARIFIYMQERPERILSRGQLMSAAYEDGRVVSDRTIDSHIKKLRLKLIEIIPDKEVISSVYSMGYKYLS